MARNTRLGTQGDLDQLTGVIALAIFPPSRNSLVLVRKFRMARNTPALIGGNRETFETLVRLICQLT